MATGNTGDLTLGGYVTLSWNTFILMHMEIAEK